MADLQLQPILQTDARAQAHLAIINRLKTLDVSPVLVYRIISLLDAGVIPMAWQFDVLNPLLLPVFQQVIAQQYASWDAIANIDTLNQLDQLLFGGLITTSSTATGEALFNQYRALILLSSALHSVMGTIGAIKSGLAGLGYPNATVQEGQNSWGGTQYPPSQGWAVFRVLVDLTTVPAGTDIGSLQQQMTAICNYWKPQRCILDSIQFGYKIFETLLPVITDDNKSGFVQHDILSPLPYEVVNAPGWLLTDKKTLNPFWNTQYQHAGVTYGLNQPHVADGALVRNGSSIAH